MNDFTILHLSDLHIDVIGEQLPVLLENLLKDIEKEITFFRAYDRKACKLHGYDLISELLEVQKKMVEK